MRTLETSATIDAPRDVVWGILSDVASWGTWLPTVTSVDPLDGPGLAVGRRFRVVQPKLRPATWVVTSVDAPRAFTWESRGPGIATRADHVFEEISPTRSRITLRIAFSGVLGGSVGWLMGSLTQSYIEAEAATLKARAEAGSDTRVV